MKRFSFGDDARRPVGAHARTHDAEAIGIDFWPFDQVVAGELARVGIIGRVAPDTAFTGLALSGSVDGKHGEAAFEERIAARRIVFFHAVHAGDVHDAGNFFAGFSVRRQMQDRLNLFSFVGKLDPLDGTAGVLNKFIVASALSCLPGNALGIAVFVNRPHGIGIETGGDVVMFARFGKVAGGFGVRVLVLRGAPRRG